MTEPFDLQPLVTQCPNCHTQFRVSEAQLQVANGKVRCGACLSVFQGVDNIVWEQDAQLEADADDALDDLLDELQSSEELPEEIELIGSDPISDPGPGLDLDPGLGPDLDLRLSSDDYPERILGLGAGTGAVESDSATQDDQRQPHPRPRPAEPSQSSSEPASAPAEDAAEALAAAVAATFSQPVEEAEPRSKPDSENASPAGTDEPLPVDAEHVEPPCTPDQTPKPASDAVPQSAAVENARASSELAKSELELEAEALAGDVEPKPAAPGPGDETQASRAPSNQAVFKPEPEPEPEPEPASAALRQPDLPSREVEDAEDPFERLNANKADELPKPGAERGWMLYAVTIGGVVLLVGQILVFRFDAWTQDPGLRPIYSTLCSVFPCELPPLQALDQMSSRNLTVRTHPEVEGALMVDTVIVNAADFPQAFPVLELTFTDIDGNVVAGRRFEPSEYLAGELKNARNIASRTPVRIQLEIKDPGPSAVSYKMDFR